MSRQLGIGDAAPGFILRSQDGSTVDLKGVIGTKDIVLYFYPKDNTSGCTIEAKAFRDSYEVFKDLGAEVIGVSSDSVDSHKDFATRCDLPFTILSDEGGKVRKLYGVPSSFGLIPGRVTYIIDRKGIIRHVFSSQMHPSKHVEGALGILKSIGQQEGLSDGPNGVSGT